MVQYQSLVTSGNIGWYLNSPFWVLDPSRRYVGLVCIGLYRCTNTWFGIQRMANPLRERHHEDKQAKKNA
ncbi:hypothetical protein BHM03_00032824 [Ensete ventricosum]|nr:hypothetical protein BHM03_00032824 [Ensete ventricosum]